MMSLKITAVSLLSLIIVGQALATEPTVITLSCDGTVKTNVGKNAGQREAINKVGLVVDLAEHTVSFEGYVANIENVDGTYVFFGGEPSDPTTGDIDRATGLMSATTVNGNVITSYELFCKPANRVPPTRQR
jgi:hypothetical protein